MTERPQKITFAEMRDMGVHGVVVYCQDYKCSHSQSLSAIVGLTICGCRTLSSSSFARSAASAARTCGSGFRSLIDKEARPATLDYVGSTAWDRADSEVKTA